MRIVFRKAKGKGGGFPRTKKSNLARLESDLHLKNSFKKILKKLVSLL